MPRGRPLSNTSKREKSSAPLAGRAVHIAFGVSVCERAKASHGVQEPIAKVFASKADDKFAELEWSWDGDVPHVHGALAYMRCTREVQFTHLDHTVLIGT